MADDDLTPRRAREPDNVRALAQKLAELAQQVAQLSKSANLRNAAISGGDGLSVYDSDGNLRLKVATDEAAIIAYAANGTETARYGLLAHSDAGQYGLEVLSGSWVHVGAQVASWDNLAGKPATFPPTLPISGGNVSGAVASANWAAQADGSSRAFNNTVGGNTFYAVWVGNDGNFNLGRNTSSIQYKENVRDFVNDLSDLMQVRPVVYDRIGKWVQPTDENDQPVPDAEPVWQEGAKDEFGLIAEEVVEVWPEVVTYYDHGDGRGPVIDGIRYDLISARLIPTLQGMLILGRTVKRRVDDLEAQLVTVNDKLDQAKTALTNQAARIKALEDRLTKAGL